MTDLSTAYAFIFDSVRELMEENKRDLGVKNIIVGKSNRNQPEIPAVWIYPEEMQVDYRNTTIQEKWTLPLEIASFVKSDDCVKGMAEAFRVANFGRKLMLENRDLGDRSIVTDIISSRFMPQNETPYGNNIYSSVAVVNVIFIVKENL